MKHTEREQKLVDLHFSMAQALWENQAWLKKAEREDVVKWVRKTLKDCGFETIEMGSSHGVLK